MIKTEAIQKFFPFLSWPRLTSGMLRSDASAALTGAIVVLPQAIAFAAIAGLPPQYGLYAAMIPAIIGALWGSSWHMVTGPTTAISIAVFASISALAAPGSAEFVTLAITLTFLVGLIQFIMGAAGLGALVNFISQHSHHWLYSRRGLSDCSQPVGANSLEWISRAAWLFHNVLIHTATHLSSSNGWVVLVSVVTLLSGLVARRYLPKFPYMIMAMVVGTLVALFAQSHPGPGAQRHFDRWHHPYRPAAPERARPFFERHQCGLTASLYCVHAGAEPKLLPLPVRLPTSQASASTTIRNSLAKVWPIWWEAFSQLTPHAARSIAAA